MKKVTIFAVVGYLVYHLIQLIWIVPSLMATASLIANRVPY